MGKAQINKLRATAKAFCGFLEYLLEERLAEQAWGPREVLVHLLFSHGSYVAQVEALLAGKRFTPPRERFSDLNAQVVADNLGVPLDELLRRR